MDGWILHVCNLKLFIWQYQDLLDPCSVLKLNGSYKKAHFGIQSIQNRTMLTNNFIQVLHFGPTVCLHLTSLNEPLGATHLKALQSEIFSISLLHQEMRQLLPVCLSVTTNAHKSFLLHPTLCTFHQVCLLFYCSLEQVGLKTVLIEIHSYPSSPNASHSIDRLKGTQMQIQRNKQDAVLFFLLYCTDGSSRKSFGGGEKALIAL